MLKIFNFNLVGTINEYKIIQQNLNEVIEMR